MPRDSIPVPTLHPTCAENAIRRVLRGGAQQATARRLGNGRPASVDGDIAAGDDPALFAGQLG